MLRLKTRALKKVVCQATAALAVVVFPAFVQAQGIPTTPGWYQIPNTKLRSVCAAENGFPEVAGAEGCAGIVNDWNGGAVDTRRNRLLIWGGGHDGYYGNELYALDLNTLTIQRLNDPGLPPASSCTDAIANGTQPNSRHTYGGNAYMENADRLFIHGGALACPSGSEAPGNQVWTYAFSATGTGTKWQKMDPEIVGTTPQGNLNGKTAAYDPNSGMVFFHDRIYLYSYDLTSNTVTQRNTQWQSSINWKQDAVVDSDQKYYLLIGGGAVYRYDISGTAGYPVTQITTTGDNSIVNASSPGLAYDTENQRIVAWDGGDTVYFLNTQTWEWTSSTFSGGPAANSNGTWDRFGYVPNLGVFVTLNSVDANGYALRLTSGGSPTSSDPDADFQARCSAPGVIKCVGFDSTDDFVPGVTIFAAGDGQMRATRDTSLKASGNSSLRFEIPSFSGPDVAGYFKGLFGQDFGPGQTFYVQWRQRFSPEFLIPFEGTSGWKHHIFWHGIGGSCTDVQLVTNHYFWSNYPIMYTACGARGLYTTMPDGDTGLEQGDYNCTHRKDDPGEDNCAFYQADQWLTYYYQVSIGDWNQPSSYIQAWVAYEGEPLKQWIDVPNFVINNDSPGSKAFRQVDLTPYMTGKDGSVSHPVAYTWYDELIISSQPIAAPTISGTPAQLPIEPSNLSVQ